MTAKDGATREGDDDGAEKVVTVGPDINHTRSPLDKKLYRQIMLPNGLRAVLISDTLALHSIHHDASEKYGHLYSDGEDGSSEGSANEGNDDGGSADDGSDGDEGDDDDDECDGLRKAAAALVVGAGSFHDPPGAQGLAHFLEHMLFLGTAKYPTENSFDEFLTHHGGYDNAYTELEHTLYHFEIPQEELWEALDRFAQFFVAPLLRGDSVDREINAIESEFQLVRNRDDDRLQQLMCHTCGKDVDVGDDGGGDRGGDANRRERAGDGGINGGSRHPFAKFSWGNNHSLVDEPRRNGVDLMAELRKFYDQYYYASNMRLVLIGAYSLDELESQVARCFSDVPPSPRVPSPYQMVRTNVGSWKDETCHSPMADFGMPFHRSTSLGRLYRVVPVRERHALSVTWQIPPQDRNWRSKPCDYLAHLLGHESGGSLLSSLKRRSWATSCAAGVGDGGHESASSHALFTLSFTLSEEGVAHWHEILSDVYAYVGMIRHYCSSPDGMPAWIYEELRAVQELAYKFGDEEAPADLVEQLAENLVPSRSLPPERILDGNELLFEFDADGVHYLVENYFTPDNARLDLISSTFGRAADFEEKKDVEEEPLGSAPATNHDESPHRHRDNHGDALDFCVGGCGGIEDAQTQLEPAFGTNYWCHRISEELLDEWKEHASPTLPTPSSMLSLPPVNPFVPTRFDLKPLPPCDSHHPLLDCSLKLCVAVGKKKEWFPATVRKYNSTNNLLLLAYEDEDEKWHHSDLTPTEAADMVTQKSKYEGTLDNKSIKFKVVSVPKEGEGGVLRFGDVTDFHVDIGVTFPPIPPPLSESRRPHLVANSKSTNVLKLWHLQDRKFKRPIAELRLRIVCGQANKTPLHRAVADLFVCLCSDALTEISYQASVCELGSSISVTDVGFTIRVHGFDHKLLDLTIETLRVFVSFRSTGEAKKELPSTVQPGRFDACLEILQRKYSNAGMSASGLCSDVRVRCLRATIWSETAKSVALEGITESEFMDVLASILDKFSVEALYHGNCDRSDAQTASERLVEVLQSSGAAGGLPKKKHPLQPVTKVPLSTTEDKVVVVAPTKDPQEPNTAVELYFQVGRDDIKERVLLDLLSQIIHEPMFDVLRTKEQFGYEVFCSPRWTYGVTGMTFKVITASRSAAEVTQRLEQFLIDFRKDIVDMSHSDFSEHLSGLAKNKLEMYNSLEEECSALWTEIIDGRYDWEVHRNEALCLRGITKDEVLAAYDDWFYPGDRGSLKERRRLVVHVIGAGDGPASLARPAVSAECVGAEIDNRIMAYHKSAGQKTWGKIL